MCVCVSRFPLYYELKIAFVIWLLSPYTRGASLIYRKCLHPLLSSRERVRSPVRPYPLNRILLLHYFVLGETVCFCPLQEIDDYIVQAKERSYETMVNFGRQGLSIAATAAVTAAVKASVLRYVLFGTSPSVFTNK